MEKIIPQTKDITTQNIEQIAKLFPQVITETEDVNGNTVKSVNFELLKQHLSKELLEVTSERYQLDWPGKRASILKANTPITSTLKPDRESSVNFDITENVYIEGDNFEVLKILQESYLGKVKMIYIDPPYNTGKDFVYKDNFKVSKSEYEEELGIEDEEGGKLFKNTDTNGRFHSDWLSMMYERLLVASDLLTDDGVIFMSIDDNEVHNLRKIADEIFGEENYVECICWNKRIPKNDKGVGNIHEYILVYTKNSDSKPVFTMRKDGLDDIYELVEKLKKNKTSLAESEQIIKKLYKKNAYDRGITLYNSLNEEYKLWGKINMSWPNSDTFGPTYEVLHPLTKKAVKIPDRGWRWKEETFNKASQRVANDYKDIKKLHDGSVMCGKIWFAVDENTQPSSVTFLDDVNLFLLRSVLSFKSDGGIELENIFDNKSYFSYPKPTNLLRVLIGSYATKKSDIILDFFSGSATTAHATIQLNAEDDGNRKFIMVQLPEEIDEKSEAYKAGYKTIPEISQERIRRAGLKILEENAEKLKERAIPLDVGFRVYKTAPSILKEVAKHPNEVTQTNLFKDEDNIKEDATDEDILTSIILDFGEKLDHPIETKTIAGAIIFLVDTDALVACFSKNIDMQVVEEIAKMQPLRAVFRDACFKDDKDLINTVESRFKQLAPNTKVHVI